MKVLLSIKPEFVEKIFAGTKKYEFRKSLFKKSGVKYVVIYASAPIKRVVGEFEIDDTEVAFGKNKQFSAVEIELNDDDLPTSWERKQCI